MDAIESCLFFSGAQFKPSAVRMHYIYNESFWFTYKISSSLIEVFCCVNLRFFVISLIQVLLQVSFVSFGHRWWKVGRSRWVWRVSQRWIRVTTTCRPRTIVFLSGPGGSWWVIGGVRRQRCLPVITSYRLRLRLRCRGWTGGRQPGRAVWIGVRCCCWRGVIGVRVMRLRWWAGVPHLKLFLSVRSPMNFRVIFHVQGWRRRYRWLWRCCGRWGSIPYWYIYFIRWSKI